MGWFAMANAVVLGLVGLRYFSGYVAGASALAWVYLLTVYFAHHVMVAVIPLFILVTPLVLLRPDRKWVTATAVLVFALLIAVIMLDSLLWSQSRFHLNALTMKILGWQSQRGQAGCWPGLPCSVSLFPRAFTPGRMPLITCR
jgi:membrane-anchored protein YejM (alkaline phosphatase superfamily)